MSRPLDFPGASGLLIWSPIPTHHQSGFFKALRARGVDLRVHYFRRVGKHRQRLGWESPDSLPLGEHYVAPSIDSLTACPDWRERIHIVPGCSSRFLLRLAMTLSRAGVRWVHWSEPSRVTFKSLFTAPIKRYYAGLVNRHALGALAIGECARRSFMRWGIRDERIRFLPYAIPAPIAVEAEASADHALPRFTFLGALCPRKGVDTLLRAFRDVLERFSSATLEIAGYDESGGRYARLAEQLKITRNVKFTGSVPAAQIGRVFSRCDVFILPSRFDGWGVVLNEAAALGKALVSTDATGAAHHLIQPGRNGLRVPANDPVALANAMLHYCLNPLDAARHGEESRELFRDFTPEKNAQRLLDGLASLSSAEHVTPSGIISASARTR